MEAPTSDIQPTEQQQHHQTDIFNSLGPYDYQNEPQFARNLNTVKVMARQQLDVSTDSPFSQPTKEPTEEELGQLKKQKADLLRRETEEIKRQLELVRSRLNELKLNEENRNGIEANTTNDSAKKPTEQSKTNSTRPAHNNNNKDDSLKLRPLTGKSDCPNCNCDRKKTSVCDYCIKFALVKPLDSSPLLFSSPEERHQTNQQFPIRGLTSHDERPIRPMRVQVEMVDEVVVPNKLYTISKSLDAKRTKLGEAIEDLQLMMERVKRREEKLEQDRKVAHLYRDQWKFGPSIGGPVASPRARLGNNPRQQPNSYQSRLDANLARDCKSLSGFQHIEPAMKLRQYNNNNNNSHSYLSRPRPAPRNNTLNRPIGHHMRSKSLETVKTSPKPILTIRKTPLQRPPSARIRNELVARSRSELDLSSSSPGEQNDELNNNYQEDEPVEERLEQEICETNEAEEEEQAEEVESMVQEQTNETLGEQATNKTMDKVQKTTWIPVFGETEVKTMKRVPKRKVQILDDGHAKQQVAVSNSTNIGGSGGGGGNRNNSRVGAQTKNKPAIVGNQRGRGAQVKSSSQVMSEASKRIHFASELLQDERRDSRNRNQIIINRQCNPTVPTARPRQSKPQPTVATSDDNNSNNRSPAQALIADATREISRLENMIGEQQRLLSQLASSSSPTSRNQHWSSGSCCHQHEQSNRSSPSSSPALKRSQLIHQLKEKLNKTKARLSKTLGEEREKHEQLKQKVDLSLKKQSDLESENELLKQSLSKCIDTCLKDISSTFESINETLTDADLESYQGREESPLNAAQLLEDNRHLRKMKSIIETTEGQRRRIFDELKDEKQRSQLLEGQLEQSRRELNELIEAKQRLELQLASMANTNQMIGAGQQKQITSAHENNQLDKASSSQQWHQQQQQVEHGDDHTMATSSTSITDDSASYNSVEAYRQYIQTLSPDLEAIKRERRLILGEFDNIKRMLSDMDR